MVSVFASIDAQAQTEYPRPVSEYVEETGPGTMTFLSYPKYYQNAESKLTEVNPNLVPSGDPAWDYEVTAGIWQLKVRKDGTFQAFHAGDSFTYRFNSLGFGRGSAYQKVDLGEPDFRHVSVIGDTVRWMDVYPDVDVSVRYIHDILKVDVKLKKAFMADLKAEVKAGRVNKDEYLTARFDIPQVMVRSTAKQNGQDKDLYAESVDVDAPIVFEKDGKEVHKLRPVETYLLDEKGEPVFNPERPVRSKQTWQLKKNASGAAEMSANVGDLAELPEGEVVIDPSIVLGYSCIDDSYIDQSNPTSNYGGISNLRVGYVYYNGNFYARHALISVSNVNFRLGNIEQIINSASLTLYCRTGPSQDLNQFANSFKVTDTWDETGANGVKWSSNIPIDNNVSGTSLHLPTNPGTFTPSYQTFDISNVFASQYYQISSFHFDSENEVLSKRGFLIKLTGSTLVEQEWSFDSTDYPTVGYRPSITVNYTQKTNNIPGDTPTFNFTFLQNYNNFLTSAETLEMVDYVRRLLVERDLYEGTNYPPYEQLQPTTLNVYSNVTLPSDFPSSFLYGSASETQWKNRLSQENTTRVGIPEYVYKNVAGSYEGMQAYSMPGADGYPYIIVPRSWPYFSGQQYTGSVDHETIVLAHQLLHELAHSCGLNHMHCQDRNGIKGPNRYNLSPYNLPEIGSAGSAFDSTQCYYFQKFSALRNRNGTSIQPGENYPDPDNVLPQYAIPTPITWSR